MEDTYTKSVSEVLDLFGVDSTKSLTNFQVSQHARFYGKNVGGDDTLLLANHFMDDSIPVLKVNSDPTQAEEVIANFSAAWCGPCRMLAPFYCDLSEKNPSLMFLLVDVDELTEFSTSWDIKATPTFFFLKDGQQIDKLVGANKPELQKKITAISDSAANYEK